MRDKFVISAYLPNMDANDLKISLSDEKDQLVCSGRRLPSPTELAAMKQDFVRRIQSNPMAQMYLRGGETIDDLLVRFAGGKYGSFEERWRLDDTVDVDGIEASYNRGVIEIVIPKRVISRPVPQQHRYGYPGPYGAGPYRRDPYGGGVGGGGGGGMPGPIGFW